MGTNISYVIVDAYGLLFYVPIQEHQISLDMLLQP